MKQGTEGGLSAGGAAEAGHSIHRGSGFGAGRRRAGLAGALLVLWLGMTIRPVEATRFVRLTIEELARDANAVVHGRVMALECQRDGQGRIFTRVELSVQDVWKGPITGGSCTVVSGGGALGETVVRAVGQPEYAVGDEVVAYLVRGVGGDWVTLGMDQGRFRVTRDDRSGRCWVHNLFWGAAAEVGQARLAAWPPTRPLSLEDLKRRTREVAP